MVLIGDLIVFPLMDVLGIGGRSTSEEHNKRLQGIRDFFGHKILELRSSLYLRKEVKNTS